MTFLDKILLAGAGLIAMTMGAPASAQPNLVATLNTNTGIVSVQNTGPQLAGASVVTVRCQGNCPEPPAGQVAPYLNAGFPNVLSINVPALQAFGSFNHQISFWNSAVFAPGAFQYQTCADAGGDVVESNERDNCSFTPRGVKRDVSGPKTLKTKPKNPKTRLKLKAN